MLARLIEIECVDDVAVDRSGTYLRVAVSGPNDVCVRTISTWLHGEAVFVEQAQEDIVVERWYRPGEVRELSRAEAEHLASRAVAGVRPHLSEAAAVETRELVTRHLHDAFVTHHLERGERVPLRATADLIRSDASRVLTAEQTDSLAKQLMTALDLSVT